MKYQHLSMILVTVTLSTALSCSTTSKPRELAAVEDHYDLTGSQLGYSDYKWGRKGPNQTAIRIYFNKDENESGVYYGAIYEYPNLMSIAPQYVASRKLPSANKYIGYLNNIGQRIYPFKAILGEKPGTYYLHSLKVNGKAIEVDTGIKPLVLTLAEKLDLTDPIAGARIVSANKKVNLYFPLSDEMVFSSQYNLAATSYKLAKLDSTWRKDFLMGPFLSAYGKLDDVALQLSTEGGVNMATFINNAAKFPKEKRKKIFTNPKSAFLEGKYEVSEPVDGMFVLTPGIGKIVGAEHVVGRIGMYLDVFDATKSLNQDVVEVAFINPSNPEDFLMYYEHPDNGEGTGTQK